MVEVARHETLRMWLYPLGPGILQPVPLVPTTADLRGMPVSCWACCSAALSPCHRRQRRARPMLDAVQGQWRGALAVRALDEVTVGIDAAELIHY